MAIVRNINPNRPQRGKRSVKLSGEASPQEIPLSAGTVTLIANGSGTTFTLANGEEGQMMTFVASSDGAGNINDIRVNCRVRSAFDNGGVRITGIGGTDGIAQWAPFNATQEHSMAWAVFTDGEWCWSQGTNEE
jgi:hypothetical protein